ncbi:hypothetical protein KP509_23G054000 [Ceratopteris richardii]|uniref:Glycine-rich protein n=1 Tax=Ceratopteris richardii TaxID=49495 RepID=A0A8T2S2Z0_CERRI|nr:hypothetical protein KP509_23G054000 [Ceratopteris richardii]
MAYIEGGELFVGCHAERIFCISVSRRKPSISLLHVSCAGNVISKRSLMRLSIFSDLFWGIINFISVFFATMFSLDASNGYGKKRSDDRASRFGGWGGGPGGGGPYGGPGRGPGPNRGPKGLSDIRGVDHSKYIHLMTEPPKKKESSN